ncbi:hypothetical protein N182_23975 [Sinorhizobium sp. GL2]|nr:hypothetical protein N182_23975 [Sinorhizobium sp. GL2]
MRQASNEGLDNLVCDFVLETENVFEISVETFGPDVIAASGIDELDVDAHTTAGAASAAFQDVANTQFACDRSNVR